MTKQERILNKVKGKVALSKLTKSELIKLIQSYQKSVKDFQMQDYQDLLQAIQNSGIDYGHEQQYIVVLNNYNVIIDIVKIDSYQKEGVEYEADILFKKLLTIPNASRLCFVHNHPTGGSRPSNVDNSMAKVVYILSSLMGFEFKDYIIITQEEMFSFMYDNPDYFNNLNKQINDILNMKVLKDI